MAKQIDNVFAIMRETLRELEEQCKEAEDVAERARVACCRLQHQRDYLKESIAALEKVDAWRRTGETK